MGEFFYEYFGLILKKKKHIYIWKYLKKKKKLESYFCYNKSCILIQLSKWPPHVILFWGKKIYEKMKKP